MLPDVKVTLSNGALGSVGDTGDGVTGMVVTGVAVAGIPLNTPKLIFSLADAEALGITLAAMPAAYRQIKEFYDGYRYISGKSVAELYIMTTADTVTMTQIADYTVATGAKKLVDFADGRIKLLGITRKPGVGYTPVVTDGIDADCLTALQKAHDLGNTYATAQQPIRTLVEGRAFAIANVGSLKDLHTYTYNRAGLVLFSTANDGSSSVGFVLGVSAALPVHRKISRVRNTALPYTTAYIGDAPVSLGLGATATIHDKGYIIARQYATRSGLYLNGDFMATAVSDDYALLCRGRVIDKAHRITYDTYVDEIEEDVDVDPETGFWFDGYVEFLKNRITRAIGNNMGDSISATPTVNLPVINVLAQAKTKIQLKLIPKGYNSNIEVELGFSNPATT